MFPRLGELMSTSRYISELSPSRYRGRLVTILALFITGGQVVAYIVGWLLSARSDGWRWMVGLGAIPAFVQISCFSAMPETPRWLVKAEKSQEALMILRRVYGDGGEAAKRIANRIIEDIYREISEEVTSNSGCESPGLITTRHRFAYRGYSHKLSQLLLVGHNRKALVIACLLQGSQQLCGFVSMSNC